METIICADVANFLNEIKVSSVLIYSNVAMKKCNIRINNNYIKEVDNTKSIYDYEHILNQYEYVNIISFGGGRTIDICKFIAKKYNLVHYCIPSMFSTNSFATDKIPSFNKKQSTIQSKVPEFIVIDKNLLMNSYEQCMWGMADVFSIHTALFDWELSFKVGKEKIDYSIYRRAQELVLEAMAYILENEEYNLIVLYSYIVESGKITVEYGCGRPESGSEHILARELEKRKKMPHGIAVFIGTILMSILQDNIYTDIFSCFKKLHFHKYVSKYCADSDIIEALRTLKPRKDRYTIINEKPVDAFALNRRYRQILLMMHEKE